MSLRPMFHASIHAPGGDALRLSGRVVPYDLELLREHVLRRCPRSTRVEVRTPPALRAAILRALAGLERRGVTLVVESEGPVAR